MSALKKRSERPESSQILRQRRLRLRVRYGFS